MGFVENAIIALTKKKLSKALDLNNVVELSSEGLKEFRDISYKNRSEKELKMDIFQPVVDKPTDLPVIINIHGGGLIDGNKNLSVGFCRQLAKRGYLVFSLEYRLIPAVRVYEQFDDVCTPAWSLSALSNFILPSIMDDNGNVYKFYLSKDGLNRWIAYYKSDNVSIHICEESYELLDVIFEMVCWLLENKKI
jgi:hypothetical protein